jgi:hypothetical protein
MSDGSTIVLDPYQTITAINFSGVSFVIATMSGDSNFSITGSTNIGGSGQVKIGQTQNYPPAIKLDWSVYIEGNHFTDGTPAPFDKSDLGSTVQDGHVVTYATLIANAAAQFPNGTVIYGEPYEVPVGEGTGAVAPYAYIDYWMTVYIEEMGQPGYVDLNQSAVAVPIYAKGDINYPNKIVFGQSYSAGDPPTPVNNTCTVAGYAGNVSTVKFKDNGDGTLSVTDQNGQPLNPAWTFTVSAPDTTSDTAEFTKGFYGGYGGVRNMVWSFDATGLLGGPTLEPYGTS